MQLQLAIGPRYAGETISVTALRGEERVQTDITLVDKLPAYRDPFLGILPLREPKTAEPEGIAVRYVYPNSPAAKAQVQLGDRLVKMGETDIKSRAAAIAALAAASPGDELQIGVLRKSKLVSLKLTATELPVSLPGDLPPAREESAEAPAA